MAFTTGGCPEILGKQYSARQERCKDRETGQPHGQPVQTQTTLKYNKGERTQKNEHADLNG